MKKSFAVKSNIWSLYKAFYEELIKLGYLYNSGFSNFEEKTTKYSSCLFISNMDWSGIPSTEYGKFYFAFSNTGNSTT